MGFALLLFVLGLYIARWAAFDGTYTALFGVRSQLDDGARLGIGILGFVLCLPLLLGALASRAIDRIPGDGTEVDVEPKQKNVTLTPWEQELIDKARKKRGG